MKLAHSIGDIKHSNYNTRQQIIDCKDEIGFDGIYLNVYENQDVLQGKKGIMFIVWDTIGKDNTFDLAHVPKLEKYCTLEQVQELCDKYGFELGYHTRTHPDLTKLSREEIMKEVMPPFPMKSFAYPYGKYNDLVIECVKACGYERAYSVIQTDGTEWTIPRPYIT